MKLLIADDHTLFRDVLTKYIERSGSGATVATARSFDEVREAMAAGARYDLVLLDLHMPGMNGMEGFKTIRKACPHVPVVLMSGVAEPEEVREALALGVAGYFPKTLSGDALLKAIRQVLSGERYIPPGRLPGEIVPSYYANGDAPKRTRLPDLQSEFALTPRETEVLKHLAHGETNKEIANALGLQVVTVKLHVRGLYRKLGVKNRTQAALMARAEMPGE